MQILAIKDAQGAVVYTVHIESVPPPSPPLNFAGVPDSDPFLLGAPYTNGTVLMVSQGPPAPAP
jgi:hypothetical protein